MAVTFEVNSNSIVAGIISTWLPVVTGQNADATQRINSDWYENIWNIPLLEMAEWEILEPLKGTAFIELKTTDQADPNATGTYSTGYVVSVTGNHRGRRMENVIVTFLVDTTS